MIHYKAAVCVGIISADQTQRWFKEDMEKELDVPRILSGWKDSICTTESPCFKATDRTWNGVVDITDQVMLGDLQRVPNTTNTFVIPYTVFDEAGNKAGGLHYDAATERSPGDFLTLEIQLSWVHRG